MESADLVTLSDTDLHDLSIEALLEVAEGLGLYLDKHATKEAVLGRLYRHSIQM